MLTINSTQRGAPLSKVVSRSLAVWAVTHNQALPEQWRVLDEWVFENGLELVVADILGMLELSGSSDEANVASETAWWTTELRHTTTSN